MEPANDLISLLERTLVGFLQSLMGTSIKLFGGLNIPL